MSIFYYHFKYDYEEIKGIFICVLTNDINELNRFLTRNSIFHFPTVHFLAQIQ